VIAAQQANDLLPWQQAAQPLDGGVDGSAMIPAGSDSAPWSQAVPQTPPASPAPAPPAAANPASAKAAPAADAGVGSITQLSDGAGGSVTVPPIAMAPASVVPPTMAAPAASDTAPWMTASATAPSMAAAPATPGTFDATNNLIDSQILPTTDPRLASVQAARDAALAKITGGPSRLDLAKSYLDAGNTGLDEQYAHDRQDATDAAGAHGQIGSGMLTNRYGDLFGGLERNKKAQELKYLTDASAGTIGDNLNALGAASGAESQTYGENAANNAQTRTERDYQRTLAEQAIQQRIQQNAAEQTAKQQSFDNAARLYGLGNLNNPTGTYENAAANSSAEASGASSSMANLIRAWIARNGTQGLTGGV
jgi:hypothetical protein